MKNLAAAVQIPTVSHVDRGDVDVDQFLLLHSFLEETYPQLYEKCQIEKVNDLSLLVTWEGSDSSLDPLLVMAHQDVVPVEPGTEQDWEVEPFSGAIADGHLWGRGTLDDKGPLIALLEAAEHLLESGFEPERTILIVSGHDEEVGGLQGAKQVAELLGDRGATPWFVVDEGGVVADEIPRLLSEPVALVRTAEKGSVTLTLTARGDGGHSSAPQRQTTIGKLATALKALESHPVGARVSMAEPTFRALEPRLGRLLRTLLRNLRVTGPLIARLLSLDPATDALIRTSTAITMISGGVKENVIPQEAWAIVNFRILPGDTVDSVIAYVRKVVGAKIEVDIHGDHHDEPSPVSSIESEAWATLTSTIDELFPEALVAPWTLIGATDSRHFAGISGVVYGFSPFTLSMADLERLHGTGERVRVADAERAVRFYVRLMENAAG